MRRRLFECEEVAARHGFEPRLTGPEPVVLPLDERAVQALDCDILGFKSQAAQGLGLKSCPGTPYLSRS